MSVQVKSSGSSPTLQSRTVTPSSSTQYITAQTGYDALSQVTVNRDSNLKSSNIKSGTSIFGILGNYTGSGWQVKRSFLQPRLGSFTTTIPISITTIQGMSFIMTETGSSSRNRITSFCCPQPFTLTANQQCLFSLAYFTYETSPYIETLSNQYACYPFNQDGYWYLNMNETSYGGFYGGSYLQIIWC